MKLSLLDEYRSREFTYYESTMQPLIMRQFQACRHSGRFIDLEVEVEGVVFPCHQILLDAFCPYFAAHFSFDERCSQGGNLEAGMVQSGEERIVKHVVLSYSGVTASGFSRILEFMYTAELQVTANDVIDVLLCADFLQFHKVVHKCSAFLQQHITAETCLQILVVAEAHDLHDLANKAFIFILHNLADMILQQEFTQISHSLLTKIVSSDFLDTETESVALKAVLTWVKGDERIRSQLIPNLCQHLRLRADDILLFKNHFHKNQTDVNSQISGTSLNWDASDLEESSLPDRLTEAMVVVCRETHQKHRGKVRDLSWLYFLHPETLQWEALTRLPFADRQDYSAVVADNILYITGGQNLDVYDIHYMRIVFNENWAYDPVKDVWEERQMMRIPRYNHSSVVLQSKLYIIGGRSSVSSYTLRADGEVYDPITNQWTFISPLRCIDGIANAAVASHDGKIYLCGGTCSTKSHQTQVPYDNYLGAQVYDPKENLWQELLSLEQEITQRRVRVCRGCLLAIDGFLVLLDDEVGKQHQLFNPVSQVMTDLMQAQGHHWSAGWTVLRGQLVCVGGVEDGCKGDTDMVHAWDLTLGKDREETGQKGWYMLPPLPFAISQAACLNLYIRLPRSAVSGF